MTIAILNSYNESEAIGLLNFRAVFRFLSSGANEEQDNGFIKATGDYSDENNVSISADPVTDRITWNSHGLVTGDRVKFGGTTPPAPLVAGDFYWVRNETANDFQVSKFPESEVIDLTDAGSTPEGIKTKVQDFSIHAPAGKIILLSRMLPYYTDQGSMDSGTYGNGINLTHGLRLINGSYNPGTEYEKDITEGLPIIDNTDWGPYVGPDAVVKNFGSGDDAMAVRWTFTKMGRPVILDGNIGEFACMRLNDNFTGLNKQYFGIQGLLCNRDEKSILVAINWIRNNL